MSKTKLCSKCNKIKLTGRFSKSSRYKDGLSHRCKDCDKEYYEKSKEQKKDYGREYYYKNKESKLIYAKDYYENNKEAKLQYQNEYSKENYSNIRAKNQKYYQSNKIKFQKTNKQHYQSNKEQYIINAREWRNKNPEACRIIRQKRRSRIKGLNSTLTVEQWEEAKAYFKYKCAYCGTDKEALTQDHFIPVSKDGEYTHNNIIPACRSCNSSKSDKDFNEWYLSYIHNNKERKSKVLEYLGYKSNVQQLVMK